MQGANHFYLWLYTAAYLAGELLQLFEWYGGEGFFYAWGRGGVAEALQRVVFWQGVTGWWCVSEYVVGLADEDTADKLDVV